MNKKVFFTLILLFASNFANCEEVKVTYGNKNVYNDENNFSGEDASKKNIEKTKEIGGKSDNESFHIFGKSRKIKNYEGGAENEKIPDMTVESRSIKPKPKKESEFKSDDKIEMLDEKGNRKTSNQNNIEKVEITNTVTMLDINNDSIERAKKELADRVLKTNKQILTKEQIDAFGMPSPNGTRFEDNNTQRRPPNIAHRMYNKKNNHLTPVIFEEDFIQNAFNLIGSEKFSRAEFFSLVEKLSQPHVLDTYGNTLLMHAIYNNRDPVVMFLIKSGIDLNKSNDFGVAPLHLAAHINAHAPLVAIMEAGGDPNILDKYGNTPLMYAALSGDIYGVMRIIELGGNINAINYKGLDVMDFAYESQNLQLIDYLIKKGHSLIKKKDLTELGTLGEDYFLTTRDGKELIEEYLRNLDEPTYFYYAN